MKIPYFDTHCDTISAAMWAGQDIRENNLHVDLKRGSEGFTHWAQVFALWSRELPTGMTYADLNYKEPDMPADTMYEMYLKMLAQAKRGFEENADLITLCLSAEDVEATASAGKSAAFLSIEGAEQIKCDIALMEQAYTDGVRIINPCWNYDNALTGSCAGAGEHLGLSTQGRDFAVRAGELRILLDMSHISEAGFWGTAEICESQGRPLFASHSDAKALCGHVRNLTDDQFKAIVRTGGVAGLNFYPDLLGPHGTVDIDSCVRHVEHFLSLGGERAICVGGDLDGISELPNGMSGIQDVHLIYDALLARGHSEELVRDIFYNNALECFRRAL